MRGLPLTIAIIAIALLVSFFLWSIGIYFFFLPIIFLPFLKFIKFKSNKIKTKICTTCGLESDGNYCPRCGTKI
ncbi:MAG: hypothetical protein OEQ12_08260 [Nitrosopumilus sp.]|nr:hypothetical protein [Nitrosopumilus sp.]